MKRIVGIMTAVMLTACVGNSVFVPDSVADADSSQVSRVEPLSWWVGMKAPLQLLVQGEGVSGYNVAIEGGNGIKVNKIHKADSPNYLSTSARMPHLVHIISYSARTGSLRSSIRMRLQPVNPARYRGRVILLRT